MMADVLLLRAANGSFALDPASSVSRVQIGASRPLRRIPAIVSFLNPQPALSLVGRNRSSCPIAAIPLPSRGAPSGGNHLFAKSKARLILSTAKLAPS
jgi:hypothetical protein